MCGIVGCVGIGPARSFLLNGPQAARIPRLRFGRTRLGQRWTPASGQDPRTGCRPGAAWRRRFRRTQPWGSLTPAGLRTAVSPEAMRTRNVDSGGIIAVVHNGIIENYRPLRALLEEDGIAFRSRDRQRGSASSDRPVLRR